MTTTKPTIADRFRAMADATQPRIDAMRRDRLSNTPKRQRQAQAAGIEADHLERVQKALAALAVAHGVGDVPPLLAGIKTKAQVLKMTRTKIDLSGGYYSVRDTGEFTDQSPEARALRDLVERQATPLDDAAAAERSRLASIRALEDALRFRDIPGFFPTPPAVVARMIELAELLSGMSVLEPSAGKGDIAEAARAAGCDVTCCERVVDLRHILEAKGFELTAEDDFLAMTPPYYPDGAAAAAVPAYDRVLLNPPFEALADIDHIRHAHAFLAPAGRLVAVCSPAYRYRQTAKAAAFRAWLDTVPHQEHELPRDAFSAAAGAFRSTGVAAGLLVVDKPQE